MKIKERSSHKDPKLTIHHHFSTIVLQGPFNQSRNIRKINHYQEKDRAYSYHCDLER